MDFVTRIEEWLTQFGVAGFVAAGLAAIILAVFGVVQFGQAFSAFRGVDEKTTAREPDAPEPSPWIMRWGSPAIVGSLAIVLALLAGLIAIKPLLPHSAWLVSAVFVFVFGGAVGAAELVSRYRDRPARAITTAPAVFYILLNAVGALGALYLIWVFPDKVGLADAATKKLPETAGVLVQAVLIAGFSSLVFFRTSIFKFRVGDSDLAIGPSIVLDSLLGAADRAVDRVMAQPRAQIVRDLMGDLSFDKAAVILTAHCMALMQNVSGTESQRIAGVVNSLRADKDMPDQIKCRNLGLALLGVVGENVLRTAVDSLRDDLQDSTTHLIKEITTVMGPVSFDKARPILPTYCYAVWPKPIAEEVKEKEKLEIKIIAEIRDAPPQYKSLILGIRMAKLTDGATLRKAVKDLGPAILDPPALPPPSRRAEAWDAADSGKPPPPPADAAAEPGVASKPADPPNPVHAPDAGPGPDATTKVNPPAGRQERKTEETAQAPGPVTGPKPAAAAASPAPP